MITRHPHVSDRCQTLLNHPQLLSPCRTVKMTAVLMRTTAALAVAGSVTVAAHTIEAAEMGPFVPQMTFTNPLAHVNMMDICGAPIFTDVDGDEKPDAILIRYESGTRILDFYRNTGSDGVATFTRASDDDNPFVTVSLPREEISIADIDSDGDVDLIYSFSTIDPVTENSSLKLNCYINEGTPSTPSFRHAEEADNPFKNISLTGNGRTCITDLNGDGRADLTLIDIDSTGPSLRFFTQDGAGSYAEQTDGDSPFSGVGLTPDDSWRIPAFFDIDTDGDQDLVLRGNGDIRFFLNTGSASMPSFVEQFEDANPLKAFAPLGDVFFSMMDMDGDGDLDLFVSNYMISTLCFRNVGGPGAPKFEAPANTLGIAAAGIDESILSTVSFADIDADGDLDAFVSDFSFDDKANRLRFYTNVGSSRQPEFQKAEDIVIDPFGHQFFTTRFADVDGDGDLDMLATTKGLGYLENIGNATTPLFQTLADGDDDPLSDIDRDASFVSLADIDNDGDLDAVTSFSDSGIQFYRKTDPALNSDNVTYLKESQALPFSALEYKNAMAELADIDGDGDYDLIIAGGSNYAIQGIEFYENTGTPKEMNLTKRTGADNPFADIPSGLFGMISVADIDGDGKADLFPSNACSPLYYYHHGIPEGAETPELDSSDAEEPDERYGSCFIGASHASSRSYGKNKVTMALAGLASVGSALLQRKKRQKL